MRRLLEERAGGAAPAPVPRPSDLEVLEVRGGRASRSFLRLPDEIYDPHGPYVAPLHLLVRHFLGPLGQHTRALLALRGGRPVARIAVRRHRHPGQEALHFGFFECLPGQAEAAAALVEEAHATAPHLPLQGPYHFRLEDPWPGLLVEGFERDPCFMMSYNPPGYAQLLESAGLRPLTHLRSYEVTPADVPRWMGLVDQPAREARELGIAVRTLDPANLDREARSMAAIFNDALSENWGFEPFGPREVAEMKLLARFFMDARWLLLARHGDRDVGCLIVVPDFNRILKPSRGRLTPGLVWHYLTWRRRIHRGRGYALGVMRDSRHLPVAAALIHHLLHSGSGVTWTSIEVSWVVESNAAMNALASRLGSPVKTYRIYERPPVATP